MCRIHGERAYPLAPPLLYVGKSLQWWSHSFLSSHWLARQVPPTVSLWTQRLCPLFSLSLPPHQPHPPPPLCCKDKISIYSQNRFSLSSLPLSRKSLWRHFSLLMIIFTLREDTPSLRSRFKNIQEWREFVEKIEGIYWGTYSHS